MSAADTSEFIIALFGLESEARFPMDVVGEELHQDQLEAIAGPKTEAGLDIPVRIELHLEPWSPRGGDSIICLIQGRAVGYMDDDHAGDPRLRRAVWEAQTSGRPLWLDGFIVGGWSRDDGKDEGLYEVIFKDRVSDSELDAGIDELLELEY